MRANPIVPSIVRIVQPPPKKTYLPELGTDLVAALSCLDVNDLSHGWM